MDTRKYAHIRTNNRHLERICNYYHVEVIAIAKDTDQGEQHWHALVAWPIRKTERYSRRKPATGDFYRAVRKITHCDHCKHWRSSTRCPQCGTWFKTNWIEGYNTDYITNTYNYIKRKEGAQIHYTLDAILGRPECEGSQET